MFCVQLNPDANHSSAHSTAGIISKYPTRVSIGAMRILRTENISGLKYSKLLPSPDIHKKPPTINKAARPKSRNLIFLLFEELFITGQI
jgi:hypothetical protein